MKRKQKKLQKKSQGLENKSKKAILEKDLERLEFHRHAMALMPELTDKAPGVVFFVDGDAYEPAQRFCTCSASKRKTCNHILTFSRLYKAFKKEICLPEEYLNRMYGSKFTRYFFSEEEVRRLRKAWS